MNIAVLFIANAAIMILEIVGARALAPFMGTSTEVWSGLIATVLLGLTIGYYFGGRIADVTLREGKSLRKLACWLLIVAGIFIILSWTYLDSIALLGAGLMASLGLTMATSAIALLAFVPASLCLSALSPVIARIKIESLDSAASTVGSLSAVAAAGSIIGSFSAGLIFIPYFGSKETLIGSGLVLVVTGIVYGVKAKWSRKNILVLLFLLILPALFYISGDAAQLASENGIVEDIDTRYQRLLVRDMHWPEINRDVRVIQTDPFGTQCAMFKDEIGEEKTNLPFVYTLAFSEATRFIVADKGTAPERVIVVGGCNYSYPSYLSQQFPNMKITVAELDPAMETIARDWFGFKRPANMRIVIGDARNFFNRKPTSKADIIYYDAFNSFSAIPHQLATIEAFRKVRRHLAEDGVLVLNIITGLEGPMSEIGGSFYKTLKEVFPVVTFYKIKGVSPQIAQNIIAIAAMQEIQIDEVQTFLEKFDGSALLSQVALTDNFAPIERLSKPIRDNIVMGGNN